MKKIIDIPDNCKFIRLYGIDFTSRAPEYCIKQCEIKHLPDYIEIENTEKK